MKKVKMLVNKYACKAMALALTLVAVGVASEGCYFVYHQPKEPEGLKKFSRNK